ncbi:hypothetical protein [Pontivivens insulae]|uniref:PH domain-containing protein n=1 Tax=Pontivivens insulae TaxID=1639689 RepID=A0A2R8A7N3_9RHOB|nr:hypothetical protein [Pontivivens insulae]RED18143.1 hypothetical protein DFR53_0337 [Pontivivens insulae]SPF28040.1 hypothetical protein POI8812_00338 [Pontivivens insulae]
MSENTHTYRPPRLIRAILLPGALFLLAFSIAAGVWAATYLPVWAAVLLGLILALLAGVAVASLVMAGQLVVLGGPSLIMDRTGVNIAAYSTGPIPWAAIDGIDITDGSAGGLRFRVLPDAKLSALSKFLIAMNGGRGGIVIANSYLNAEPEAVMETAQRLKAESPS